MMKNFKDIMLDAMKDVDNLMPVDMGDQLIPIGKKNGRTILIRNKICQ